jgi:hypothetical protein
MNPGTIDRTGQVMGNMKVLSFSHHRETSGNAMWNMECIVCGHKTTTQWNSRTKCGCQACHGRKQMRHIKYKEGRSSDLYMMKCGPYVKIGVTDNVDIRLRSINSNNPYPVELIGLWEGEGHREEEWHKSLSHLHHKGEWFKLGNICEIT